MKIFFMGATKFGESCLRKLIALDYQIVGCAYTPKKFEISYAPEGVVNVNYYDFKQVAEQLNIACIPYLRGETATFAKQVKALSPDLIIVAGWYYFVPASIRDIPDKGTIALHGSLLPKYRGGAPLVWSIINGEKTTGVSLFYLDDGVDTGDVIGQKAFAIHEHDTIADLLPKLERASHELLEEFCPLLRLGQAPRISQDESQATVYPQRSPQDGQIDWTGSPKQIRDFIRAQTKPYPGAFTILADKKVILWDADICEAEDGQS